MGKLNYCLYLLADRYSTFDLMVGYDYLSNESTGT